jgi:hypothetical protein
VQNISICKTVIFSVVFVGIEMSFMLREEINYKCSKKKCLGKWLDLENFVILCSKKLCYLYGSSGIVRPEKQGMHTEFWWGNYLADQEKD